MWALNKGDWPWLLLGLLGAIIAGGTNPSEGVFIAHVQVFHRTPHKRNQQQQRVALSSILGLIFARPPPPPSSLPRDHAYQSA